MTGPHGTIASDRNGAPARSPTKAQLRIYGDLAGITKSEERRDCQRAPARRTCTTVLATCS